MANPTCDLTKLIDESGCYACLSPAQKKAALVLLGVWELEALGGTHYDTATFPAELVADAQALFQIKGTIEMWDSPLLTAYVAIAAQNAENAGATVDSDVSTWNPKLNLLLQAPSLDTLLLFVTCALGTHKAYPQ